MIRVQRFSGGSSGGNDAVGVACCVYPLLLLGQVVGPVVVEVAVAAERPELEDGLGAGQAPASAGAVHAVFDQVPAGALDRAGGDRPATGERGRVVQVGLLVEQVGGGGVGGLALGGVQVVAGGLAADRRSDDADASVQDRPGVIVHPGLGSGVALGEKAPSGPPHILEHVHEVDHDRHVHAAHLGFGADPSELVVVAVDQRDPGAVLVGVATGGLVEHLADHLGGVQVTLATSHLPRARGRVRPGGWG